MGVDRNRLPVVLAGIGVALMLVGVVALQFRKRPDRRFVEVPGRPGQYKTAAAARAERRAYDALRDFLDPRTYSR